METYKNLGGNSNVIAYEISNDAIIVQFGDGSKYLYNHSSPGSMATEQMKNLAIAGQGLNSYIGRYVKKNYAAKLR